VPLPRVDIARVASGVLMGALLLRADVAWASEAAPGWQGTVLDEVLVTGVQPGPGLWKVSRGDHVLWILGSYEPLPRKLQWRSTEVEAAMAQSQEFLAAVDIKAKVGFFRGLGLLPALVGVRNNPDDKRLQDVLPPALYARWLLLKQRYLGHDESVEKWRPVFAAYELYNKAVEQSGLQPRDVVRPAVDRLADKHRLRRIEPKIEVEIDQPRALVKSFKKSPLDDTECFAKTIERLETDLGLMRARANAWAVGDVASLRRMTPVDQASACIAAVMNSELVRDGNMQDMPARVVATWMTAAEAALARNKSTVTVLPMAQILKTDGYVEQLRARGYAVQSP
jgi:hypothetical protein